MLTCYLFLFFFFFFFQAEDGIRDDLVTGVQTCALPIFVDCQVRSAATQWRSRTGQEERNGFGLAPAEITRISVEVPEIGRASCRERVWMSVVVGAMK